jgi:hypothetical protein
MNSNLTIDYKPRFPYYSELPLNHPQNEPFVSSLAVWALERINGSAKPYHKKHLGVIDNGAKGKEVTITLSELKEIIIKSNGVSPDGQKIHFAPVGILRKPGEAERIGLVTSEQRNRFPSFDRIDSSKGYIKGNIQLSTKNYNLGKSNNFVKPIELKGNATLNYKGIELQLNEVTSSFLVNTLKGLAA